MKVQSIDPRPLPEYDGHERVIRIENPALGVSGFIAVHRRRETYPSLGATRLRRYLNEEEAIRDALRLSRLMSYKSAFAGLPYGGAKAVIITSEEASLRREELFTWYAEAINSCEGAFVTGSDVGVFPEDVQTMRAHSPFVIGAGVPAEYYTALGVQGAIESLAQARYGTHDLRNLTFAIQGLGKTGFEVLRLLYPRAKGVTVSDTDPRKISRALDEFPHIDVVPPELIHAQAADIFCPCALQHSINAKTINELRAGGIVGSANNQLEAEALSNLLHARKILYVPDYIANNGGLISVADQYAYGTHDDARIIAHIGQSREELQKVLHASLRENRSPVQVAEERIASLVI